MSDEFGPWVEHAGDGYPAPPGTGFKAEHFFTGSCESVIGSSGEPEHMTSWSWKMTTAGPRCRNPHADPILRYRLRRPRSVRLLADLLEALPARELEDV